MSADSIADSIGQDVATSLARQVRDAYPYLKTEALDRLVDNTAALITSSIQAEESNMAASKLRVNLLTLPAELRNAIYEMTLDLNVHKQLEITAGTRSATAPMPPLLVVSRQIRSETLSIFWGGVTIALHMNAGHEADHDHVFQLHERIQRQLVRLGAEQIGLVERVKLMVLFVGDITSLDARKHDIVKQLELDKFGFRLEKISVEVELLYNNGLVVDRARRIRVLKQTGWY